MQGIPRLTCNNILFLNDINSGIENIGNKKEQDVDEFSCEFLDD